MAQPSFSAIPSIPSTKTTRRVEWTTPFPMPIPSLCDTHLRPGHPDSPTQYPTLAVDSLNEGPSGHPSENADFLAPGSQYRPAGFNRSYSTQFGRPLLT